MNLGFISLLIVFGTVFFLVSSSYFIFENVMAKLRRKKLEKLAPGLEQMFIEIPVHKLILLDVSLPIIFGMAGFFLFGSVYFALGCAAIGMVAPVFIIKKMAAMRKDKFSAQLVDALLILTSSLKAGLSLVQSFQVLTEEMPAPISQEFGLVVRQMQMGISLEEAMANLRKRLKIDELDMIVTAMMVARESGGNLTETFSRLIYTIQERNKLNSRVKVLCVQAQMQGVLMSILPVVFMFFVKQASPDFFDVFLKDNLGRMILAYAVVSEVVGVFLIMKLSKVDI